LIVVLSLPAERQDFTFDDITDMNWAHPSIVGVVLDGMTKPFL
jgi:hypothetical protein